MNKPDYREEQRAGRFHMVTVVRPHDIEPGRAVKTPGGAIYGRSSDGKSLLRLNKAPRSKKERRRLRSAAKAAEKLPVEQLQADLAGEGA